MVIYLKYEKKRFITVRVCVKLYFHTPFMHWKMKRLSAVQNLESITFYMMSKNAERDEMAVLLILPQ